MFFHSQPFYTPVKVVWEALADFHLPLSPNDLPCKEAQQRSYSLLCTESISNRCGTTGNSVGVVMFQSTNVYTVKGNCGSTIIEVMVMLLKAITAAKLALAVISRILSGYSNTNAAHKEYSNEATVTLLAAQITLLLIFDYDSAVLLSAGYSCTLDIRVDGGFGRSKVYRGTHTDSDQTVAVKRIEIGDGDDYERECRRISREFDVVRSLNHDNILKYYDVVMNNEGRTVMLAMELCTGGSLKTIAKSISLSHVRFYIHALLNGVRYLHSQQICHLDLKSENVVFTVDGKLKICDFGELVTLQQPLFDGITNKDRVPNIGTILYMSPEMIRADDHTRITVIGQPSDIWSFGCVALELLTGRPPQYCKQQEDGKVVPLQEPMAILYCVGNGGKPQMSPNDLAPDAVEFLGHCFETSIEQRWSAERLECHSFFYGLW